jgi:hypothetical protein
MKKKKVNLFLLLAESILGNCKEIKEILTCLFDMKLQEIVYGWSFKNILNLVPIWHTIWSPLGILVLIDGIVKTSSYFRLSLSWGTVKKTIDTASKYAKYFSEIKSIMP